MNMKERMNAAGIMNAANRTSVAVKGGAFDSKRTECRTEARAESRKAAAGYPNVTFRVVREDR